jgi:hypothetical protein
MLTYLCSQNYFPNYFPSRSTNDVFFRILLRRVVFVFNGNVYTQYQYGIQVGFATGSEGAASPGGELIMAARSSQPRDHITAENPTENARRRATPARTAPRSSALWLCRRRPTPRWRADELRYRRLSQPAAQVQNTGRILHVLWI